MSKHTLNKKKRKIKKLDDNIRHNRRKATLFDDKPKFRTTNTLNTLFTQNSTKFHLTFLLLNDGLFSCLF